MNRPQNKHTDATHPHVARAAAVFIMESLDYASALRVINRILDDEIDTEPEVC